MRLVRLTLLVAMLTVSVMAIPSIHATTIVVNIGSNQTAAQAGTGEADVNWSDADGTDDTICTECFSAIELQRYLRQMTGRADDFRIADDDAPVSGDMIIVGGPQSNSVAAGLAPTLKLSAEQLGKLGPEGYVLRSGRNQSARFVLIAGGGRIGTMYGAYDFLRRLGVRWYAPGESNEEVPARKLSALPDLDESESPAFFTRGFHAWENRGDEDFLLWMARNRLNYWCVEQDNKPLLHKLGIMLVGGAHVLTSLYLGPALEYPYSHPQFPGDDGRPDDPYAVSEKFMGDANSDGKLSYFEAHPEWYALREGERSNRIYGDGGDNFCTSNEDAMAEWMKNAIEDLATGRYKDAGIINAWMLDGGRWCQCEECVALGSQTDRNILFVHEYAKQIKKARQAGRINRQVRLLFLAYADVLEPPTHPIPADFDYETCIATYFPIVRCYVHEFADPACGGNRRYNGHLHGWARADDRYYKGQICIGEYYNVSGYKCLPIVFKDTMVQDIPYYYSLGARHFHYMHCTTQNWGNKALTNWQMAHQLWNPEVDCGVLWNDYFSGRYGAAASEMREVYDHLQWMLCNVSDLKYGLARRLERGTDNLFPTSHLGYEKTALAPGNDASSPMLPPDQVLYAENKGPSLLDGLARAAACRATLTAVLATDLPDRVRRRIQEDERSFTYGEQTLRFYDALAQTYFRLRDGKEDLARKSFAEAQKIAGVLKADTTSTKFSSSHASASDALSASYASGALGALTLLMGPLDPDAVKTLEPGGALVMHGSELFGGGALRYGYGFHKYPERVLVSAAGNFVYGKDTGPHGKITGWFKLDQVPAQGIDITVVGMIMPELSKGTIEGRVLVNGNEVFRGNLPFPNDRLEAMKLAAPAKALKAGRNVVELQNVEPSNVVGGRPWFGVDRVEIAVKAQDGQ